jgi:CheY-like chemotaxis protein
LEWQGILIDRAPDFNEKRNLMALILIVEDETLILQMAEMTLQDSGHQTLAAGDVDEALSLLTSSQQIDALFTDIYLKNAVLGGCELADLAIKLRPKLRVLYTTGNFITDQMRHLFLDGTHCLAKPYTPSQLSDSVEELLATYSGEA